MRTWIIAEYLDFEWCIVQVENMLLCSWEKDAATTLVFHMEKRKENPSECTELWRKNPGESSL